MSKRKPTLSDLWLKYINQPSPLTRETMEYIAALKAYIDVVELEKAEALKEVRQLRESNSTFADSVIKKD